MRFDDHGAGGGALFGGLVLSPADRGGVGICLPGRDHDALLTNYAWYSGNSDSRTHPVGQKAPNPWGLYDMHGNVLEWCQDSWDASANYPGGSTIDPLVTTGYARVLRGGSYSRAAGKARFGRIVITPTP